MEKKSFDTLQAGRALAAIAVMLFHVNFLLGLDKYLGVEVFHLAFPGSSGVNFFFVLSGFVISLSHINGMNPNISWQVFLKKRFLRIFPPLWAALIILVPIFFIIPQFSTGPERNGMTIFAAFAAVPVEHEYILATEWTLRHEILFYLIFSVIFANWRAGTIIITLWIVLSALSPLFGLDYPLSFILSPYHVLFALGIVAAYFFERGFCRYPGITSIAGSLVFAATWYAVYIGVPDNAIGIAGYGVGALLLILGVATLDRQNKITTPAVLVLLGEASYSVYLVHFPLASAVAKLVSRFKGIVADEIIFLIVAAIALIGGVVFHFAVERPLLAALKNLSRARRLPAAS